MGKKLLELAVEIVHAQASISKMTAEEIEKALVRAYNALQKMSLAEEEQGFTLAGGRDSSLLSLRCGDPHSSIEQDKVTCMECKAEFRQLTANHLRIHHLTPREYKKKWGFPLKQPLSARMLTRLRSRSAKKRGLPEKLRIYLDQKRENKTTSAQEFSTGGPSPGRRTFHGTI